MHFRALQFWSNNHSLLIKNIGFVNWNLKKTLVVFVFVFGTGRLLFSAIKVFSHQYNSRIRGRNFRKTTLFSMKYFQTVVFSLRFGLPHNNLYFAVFLVRFRKQIESFMLLFYWRNTTGTVVWIWTMSTMIAGKSRLAASNTKTNTTSVFFRFQLTNPMFFMRWE